MRFICFAGKLKFQFAPGNRFVAAVKHFAEFAFANPTKILSTHSEVMSFDDCFLSNFYRRFCTEGTRTTSNCASGNKRRNPEFGAASFHG